MPPAGATVLLCTKCYDNAAVLARLAAPVTLMPIQNGFDRALAAHNGHAEGIASFVSECYPRRTHTRITRKGRLHICESGAVSVLADLLGRSALFRVEVVSDILPYKYTKLMYNAAISPLAAAAGLDNGQLLSLPSVRRLFFRLLLENYSILHDAQIPLGKIGPFHPDQVAHILRRPWIARALAWVFYPTLRGTYCSMSPHELSEGRTEIDYFNRHLIDLAGDRPCPLNRRVYNLIKRMESEGIVPCLKVLGQLAGGCE